MRKTTDLWWLAASLAVTLVGGGLVPGPAQAQVKGGGKNLDQYTYELRSDRLDGPKAFDVPAPAPGVRYVRFSFDGGDDGIDGNPPVKPWGVFLGSDGRLVGSGPKGVEKVAEITKLFPGQRFLDWADRADWFWDDFITFGGRVVTTDQARKCFPPQLPAGDRYVSFMHGMASLLMTAQGRIVSYWTSHPEDDEIPEEGYTPPVYPCPPAFVSAPGLYVDGWEGKLPDDWDDTEFLLGLRANGKVEARMLQALNHPYEPFPKVPKLPRGMKYVSAKLRNPSVLLRSDGRLVYLKDDKYTSWTKRPQPPKPPAGMKYVDLEMLASGLLVKRSDGDVVLLDVGDTSHLGKLKPWYRFGPDQGKGLRYHSYSSWIPASNSGSRLVYLFESIPAGEVVPSGVAKVTVPKGGVVRGKTARVKVRVVSKALLRGGLVRVTYKDKTIGKTRIKNSATVTVRIKTKRLHATGKNTIKVQYMGHGQAKRSTKAKATIKTRRR